MYLNIVPRLLSLFILQAIKAWEISLGNEAIVTLNRGEGKSLSIITVTVESPVCTINSISMPLFQVFEG